MTESMQVFADMGNGQVGPFSLEQISQLIRAGMITTQTPISGGPNHASVPASKVAQLAPLFAAATVTLPQSVTAAARRVADMTPAQLGESIRLNVFVGILAANLILGILGGILIVLLRH